jgi:uncharacterized membrane protein YoaK (UPF0700 family)
VHGPLPGILIMLTIVTGVVDAVSYLRLGHVFVANMTGNVVFLGFGLAGATDVNVFASLAAIGAFVVGAFAGGRLGVTYGSHRGRLMAFAVAIKVVFAGAAVTVAAALALDDGTRYALIGLLAFAMGLQNAVARRIAVPDLTTTVLTMTVTGLAADLKLAGGKGPNPARRLASLFSMLVGAVIGGLLVLHVSVAAALGFACAVLAFAGYVSWNASRGEPEPWAAAR